MAFADKIGFDLRVVVNLAVEDDAHRAVFIEHRLMTGGKVNDAEPAMPQANHIVNIVTKVIRPTMCERVSHFSDPTLEFLGGLLRKPVNTANSAHFQYLKNLIAL